MTLDELQLELRNVLQNPTVEQSLLPWLNQCMVELAAQFELPALRLRTPATLATTTANHVYLLSAATHTSGYVYQKKLVRVTSAAFPQGFGLEPGFMALEDVDPTHAETGDDVQRVALDGDALMVFPKANDTLSLWFYRRPVDMVAPTSVPDGLPEAYHFPVLLAKVVIERAFRRYPEDTEYAVKGDNTRSLTWWTARYRAGLYGDGTSIGLIDFLAKSNRPYGPRVHGPRRGSNVGGGGMYVVRR